MSRKCPGTATSEVYDDSYTSISTVAGPVAAA